MPLHHRRLFLEYKRDLSTPDGLLRTLVAFANTAGGVLVVGVEDGTRRVIGITTKYEGRDVPTVT